MHDCRGAAAAGIEPHLQPTADGLGTLVPPEVTEDILPMRRCGRCPGSFRPAQRATEYQLDDRATLDAEGAVTVHQLYIEALQAILLEFASGHP